MQKKRSIATVVVKRSLKDASPDIEYWKTQSYAARLAALEQLRSEYHEWKYGAQPRLQRVYRIIKRA